MENSLILSHIDIQGLCQQLTEEIQGERKYFMPAFAEFHPAPLATALREIAVRFVADVECSMHGCRILNEEVLIYFYILIYFYTFI